MPGQPIVVGIDASPAAAAAARLAWRLAAAAGSPCRLVHVTHDLAGSIGTPRPAYRAAGRRAFLLGALRSRLELTLSGTVPPDVLHGLVIREGDAPAILEEEAQAAGAESLVLGAKRHSHVARWLGGSTVHRVLRLSRVPLVVAVEPVHAIRRILVAVDTTPAAGAALAAGRRLSEAHKAELRVLHAIEPQPVVSDPPVPDVAREYERLIEERLDRDVWPLVAGTAATTVVGRGSAPEVIGREAAAWHADIVVVASHGKRWMDRLLLGSCTERLLRHLPASLLVVPSGVPAAGVPPVEPDEVVAACGVGPEAA